MSRGLKVTLRLLLQDYKVFSLLLFSSVFIFCCMMTFAHYIEVDFAFALPDFVCSNKDFVIYQGSVPF